MIVAGPGDLLNPAEVLDRQTDKQAYGGAQQR
jgi:hypothetical protein